MKAYLSVSAVPIATFVAMVMFATIYLGTTSTACATTMSFEYVNSSDCGYQEPQNSALSGDRRYLFFPEVKQHRIVVLDAATLTQVGEFGHGELRWPHDVSMGPDNRLYVADSGNDRIAVYAVDGATASYRTELRGDFDNPEGVLAHPDGRVFVTGEDSGSVAVFDNGIQLHVATGLDRPHGIAMAHDGSIWVVESGAEKLTHFDADLRPTGRMSSEPLSGPRYLSLADDGLLYLTEKYGHTIAVLSPSGTVVTRFGSGKPGFGPDVFNKPEGIAVADGYLWVTDTSNGRIVRYRQTGNQHDLVSGAGLRPALQ